MEWDWTIAGWIVAVLSMLFNAFQWITNHYQTEKQIKADDLRAERQRDQEKIERVRHEWNALVDPIRAQAAKWILDPDFENPVDFSASTRINHLLPQPDRIRFGACVSTYDSVVEQGLVFKKTGRQTQFRKAKAEAKRLLLSEIWPYLQFRD